MDTQVVDGDSFWGDHPDDDRADEFSRLIEKLRLEAEAAKTPEQRQADTEEAEATKAADAAVVAKSCGTVVRRPGGAWLTAGEHWQHAEKHWARAVELRRSAGAGDVVAARRGSERQKARARAPRRNVRGRSNRARAPGREDGDDPEAEPAAAPRRCAGCGGTLEGRRRDARTHGPTCRQAASRAARRAADEPELVHRFRALCRAALRQGVLSPEEALLEAVLLPQEKLERLRDELGAPAA
ncbi:MAG: hypothetical protein WKF41_17460 [Gaiellaceae bacterium]